MTQPDPATFAITATVVGMGGTLCTLALFVLLIRLLCKLFPVVEDTKPTESPANKPRREDD